MSSRFKRRARLLRLYGAGVGADQLDVDALRAVVDATDGRTATYIREVVRRAALRAADEIPDGDLRVDGAQLASAASDLLDDGAAVTRLLLGRPDEPDAEPPIGGPMGPIPAGAQMMRMMRYGPGSGPGAGGPAAPFAPEE